MCRSDQSEGGNPGRERARGFDRIDVLVNNLLGKIQIIGNPVGVPSAGPETPGGGEPSRRIG